MKAKFGRVEIEGSTDEIYVLLTKLDIYEKQEYNSHEQELKQEPSALEKAIATLREEPSTTLPTIFSTEPVSYHKKPRNKWKNKRWQHYVPEFLSLNPLYKSLGNKTKRKLITKFLRIKLKVIEVKPVMIAKFKNALGWYNYKSHYEPVKTLYKEPEVSKQKHNYPEHRKRINWNKIALTWAALTPKPKQIIFLRKAIGYLPNIKQKKRFNQELDSIMMTKKIPIKQNNPLNYISEPKHKYTTRIQRNWITLATKYLDEKYLNPNLTITGFCRKEFGIASGSRYMKLKKTLEQITTFKKQITESPKIDDTPVPLSG